ncbi:Leucine Rich repeats (2 copies) [compost metagenome]|jgi:hypothetical protein
MNLYEQRYRHEIHYPGTEEFKSTEPLSVRAVYYGYGRGDFDCSAHPNLHYLSYRFVSVGWSGLSALRWLEHFSCEQVYTIPPCALTDLLSKNLNLIELGIDKTKLSAGDKLSGIGQFKQLTHLRVTDVELAGFPDEIFKLAQLEELELTAVDLSAGGTLDLSALKRLRSLRLVNCKLASMPAGLDRLPELELLDLTDNPLRVLPEYIGSLARLQELRVAGCSLETLPQSIADLPRIKKIDATRNGFTHLPDALGRLKSKLTLELRYRALYDPSAKAKYANVHGRFAQFTDFGFRLMVIQKLMYEDRILQPAFDVYEFARDYPHRTIDLFEGLDAYNIIPEVKAWFENLPIPLALLEDIQELWAAGGDEIYQQITPQWDGEDDSFVVQRAADARQLPNLKRVVASGLLTPQAIGELEALGIDVVA